MHPALRAFALDTRSVALGRTLIAALLLVDLSFRALDLEVFYSDAGVLPRSAINLLAWDFTWSLHALSGAVWFQGLLFLAAAALALLLLSGRYARWAALASWVLLVSLHARNPLLRDGQDDLFRILLFWLVFLPEVKPARLALSVGTGAYVVQMCAIYWVGVVTKLASPWWSEGDAVFYVSSMSRYQTPLAGWLTGHPGLCSALTYAVIVAEVGFPLLLFVPWQRARLRLLAVGAMVFMHLSFALFMKLGVFPFLSAASWLVLLPSEVWRAPVESVVERRRVLDTLAAAGLVLVLVLNVPVLVPGLRLPRPIAYAGATLGLQQNWGVFAPNPVTPLAMSNGWYTAPATLAGGEQIDLLPDRAPRNHRWRHYLANLRVTWPRGSPARATIDASRAAWARRLCREHDAAVLSIVYVNQRLGEPDGPTEPIVLHREDCPSEN